MYTEGSTGPEHTLHVENWLSTVHWTDGVLPEAIGGDDVRTSADDRKMGLLIAVVKISALGSEMTPPADSVTTSDEQEMRSAGDTLTAADDPELVSRGDTVIRYVVKR